MQWEVRLENQQRAGGGCSCRIAGSIGGVGVVTLSGNIEADKPRAGEVRRGGRRGERLSLSCWEECPQTQLHGRVLVHSMQCR
jgi:hypothetical protein